MKFSQVHSLMLPLIVVVVFSTFARAEIEHGTVSQSIEDTPDNQATILSKDCGKSYSAKCLKLDVVSFLDRLSEQDDLGLWIIHLHLGTNQS